MFVGRSDGRHDVWVWGIDIRGIVMKSKNVCRFILVGFYEHVLKCINMTIVISMITVRVVRVIDPTHKTIIFQLETVKMST
jgi:hypothetical protein